jgi:hypothetical protein
MSNDALISAPRAVTVALDDIDVFCGLRVECGAQDTIMFDHGKSSPASLMASSTRCYSRAAWSRRN